jgi:hypothetical protein
MYNTKIICTYHFDSIFTDNDHITDSEKGIIQDIIYRQEFLNIFGIDEYDDTIVMKSLEELCEKIKNSPFLVECLNILSQQLMSTEPIYGLMLMFSCDYMYCAHECISQFIETGEILQESENQLRKLVFLE